MTAPASWPSTALALVDRTVTRRATAAAVERGTVTWAVTPTWSDAQSGGGPVRNGSAPVRATLLTRHPSRDEHEVEPGITP